MNLAQAIVPLGDGCSEWRSEVVLPRSVLVFELKRMLRAGFSQIVEARGTEPYRKRHALSPGERQAVAVAQLRVLRNAVDAKLSFAEVCARAQCPFNQTTRRILQEHIEARAVETEGRGRAARYWARNAR